MNKKLMEDINTTRVSNIGRKQTEEQKETSMSGDELLVGQNQNSFDQADFSEQEAEQLKSVKNDMKLNRLKKYHPNSGIITLYKVNNRFFCSMIFFCKNKTNKIFLLF